MANNQVTIYIAPEHLEIIDSKAEAEGCSRSEYLVRCALGHEGLLTAKARRSFARQISAFIKEELAL